MTADPASLERLHDLVLPPAAPWWPPAPGWLWLLGMLGVIALALLLRGFVQWQRNRYRREALALLAALEAGPAEQLAAGVAEILKRAALTAYPRTEVATLTGTAWFAFLDRTGGTRFAAGAGAALEAAVHGEVPGACDGATGLAVLAEARAWVRRHRPELPAGGAA